MSTPNKLCTFDPFNWGIPYYTFYYTCEETKHQLKLNNGSLRIFLNTDTTELATLDAKLQAFYHYIQEGAVESELSQTICDKITTLKQDSITRRYYLMTALKIADLQQAAREEGFSLGREEGISLGMVRGREEGAYHCQPYSVASCSNSYSACMPEQINGKSLSTTSKIIISGLYSRTYALSVSRKYRHKYSVSENIGDTKGSNALKNESLNTKSLP